MKTVYLCGPELRDKEALHSAIARQLAFPDWYGENLDALYDLLTDQSEDCRVVLAGREALEENLGDYARRVYRVLEDAGVPVEYRDAPEMDLSTAREKLMEHQMTLSAYGHAMGLLYYDGATAAPRGTAKNRAQTMAVLAQQSYDLSTGPETVALLDYLDLRKAELSEKEQRMVFLLLRDIRQMQKIPRDEYVALQRLLAEAEEIWRQAKEKSDFEMFAPTLEKIFDAYRRIAGYCAPDKAPYDYWLDRFEEGVSMESCDRFFSALRSHIVPLLKKVQARPQLDNSMLRGCFPEQDQQELSRRLMAILRLDPEHVALSTTEHPFTTSLGSHLDERITTHYYEEDFSYSMFSVIHEGGHALYDTGSDDSLAFTVLDGGVSMGIHESQSRFYENLMARSLPFCQYLFPIIGEIFPEAADGRTAEDLYRAVNRSEPSLIRTEADELTYCLHVMIRYELEKKIFSGELTVRELPEAWNSLYREYLGIEVPDNRCGVLQDSHWSGGNIGYFPSYALGSAYGAQLLQNMEKDLDVWSVVRSGDLRPVTRWLGERIHQYGQLLTPAELLESAFHAPFDPNLYVGYLKGKYGELYGL